MPHFAQRLAVAIGLGALALLGLEARAVSRDLETPRDLHRADFVGSAACTRCHEDHAESFGRTFHRTMTREASRDTVFAPFAGESLSYGGVEARMTTEPDREGAPRFVITLSRAGREIDRAVVSRTVGSHRDQQLLAREDDRWVRLPVAWDIEEARWIHMNEAFLTPDPEGLDDDRVTLADYARHVVSWNDNCVFCHNVGPRPGRDRETGRFSTEVAELGVACEACHGPGGDHVRANANPMRRYALHLGGLSAGSPTDRADPTIVSPMRLTPERSADVCGRCHGQRITDDVSRFLEDGDPFVPGEDLALYSTPLFIDTTLAGNEGAFAARFWDDGTARLTAYEFQGYTQSRCATEGSLTCTDCHAMHDGDPRGQIRPSMRGDAMCTRCHDELASERTRLDHVSISPAIEREHARVECVDCHMPRVVYGLREAHRSHRIDVPRPTADRSHDRLDACALCHLDGGHSDGGHSNGGGPPDELAARPIDDLFAGDPIQRVIVASALGRVDPEAPDVPFTTAERSASLLETMRDDRYPGVRSVAFASLRAITSTPMTTTAFSPTGSQRVRNGEVLQIAETLSITVPPPDLHASLRARASERAIEIGE